MQQGGQCMRVLPTRTRLPGLPGVGSWWCKASQPRASAAQLPAQGGAHRRPDAPCVSRATGTLLQGGGQPPAGRRASCQGGRAAGVGARTQLGVRAAGGELRSTTRACKSAALRRRRPSTGQTKVLSYAHQCFEALGACAAGTGHVQGVAHVERWGSQGMHEDASVRGSCLADEKGIWVHVNNTQSCTREKQREGMRRGGAGADGGAGCRSRERGGAGKGSTAMVANRAGMARRQGRAALEASGRRGRERGGRQPAAPPPVPHSCWFRAKSDRCCAASTARYLQSGVAGPAAFQHRRDAEPGHRAEMRQYGGWPASHSGGRSSNGPGHRCSGVPVWAWPFLLAGA